MGMLVTLSRIDSSLFKMTIRLMLKFFIITILWPIGVVHAESLNQCIPIGITWDIETPYAGIDNWCTIATSLIGKVESEDIKISIVTLKFGAKIDHNRKYVSFYGNDGCFNIHFEVPGVYKIQVGKDYVLMRVRTLTPMFYYAGFPFDSEKECIPANVLKAQRGIYNQLDCCNISGGCKTIKFDILISEWKGYTLLHNESGNLTKEVKSKLQSLDVNDIISFINIKYRCPGDEKDRSYFNKTFIMCGNSNISNN